MNCKKNRVRFWLFFAAVLVVALGAITVANRWHRLFPSDEVSELYTRYADREGVTASYIKGYRVNDTTRLDVTLLEVSDSIVWEQVCGELHLLTTEQIPEEYREYYFTETNFESYVVQDTAIEDSEPHNLKTVFIYSRYHRTVCIFHSITNGQYAAIMGEKFNEISR